MILQIWSVTLRCNRKEMVTIRKCRKERVTLRPYRKERFMPSSRLYYNTIIERRRIHDDTAERMGGNFLFFFTLKYVHVHVYHNS